MSQRTYVEILSSQEDWRARKRRKSCSRCNRKNFLPLECSPNFPRAQYLDIRTAESWTNSFITLSKLSMQQLPYIFIIIACTQSSTRQCLREYVFLPHSYVFVLKLRESLIKSLKITVKKILKSILRCRKSIDSPKHSFWKKQLCKTWFAQVIARTARTDDNNNNTHLFSLLSIIKFNRFLLNFRCKTHG